MDSFEKYLNDNKRKLELDEINPRIWSAIEREFIVAPRKNVMPLYRRIAGIAGVLLVGFVSLYFFSQKSQVSFPDELLANYGFDDANVDQLLNQKVNKIKGAAIPVSYKNDLESLLNQVKYLDRYYASKVLYLNETMYETEIAKEVLKYYKAKSEVLDKVIFEIQKINKNEEKYNIKSERTYVQI